MLDRNNMNVSVDGGAKHVKKLTVLLNRLLGMNLQQQQIVFGYALHFCFGVCIQAEEYLVLGLGDYFAVLCLWLEAADVSPAFCRYLQQLIDQECETAKQNGTFDKGVLFLEGNVKEVDRKTVWRSPKAGGGEVRSLHLRVGYCIDNTFLRFLTSFCTAANNVHVRCHLN